MPDTGSPERSLSEHTGIGVKAALKFVRPRRSVNRVAWLIAALILLAAATMAAAAQLPPFYGWYYHWAWYPLLIALGSSYALATGRAAGSTKLWLSLLFWSAPLWFTFELINLRIANWYYVFAAGDRTVRVVAAFTAFATVLPAIYLMYRWLERIGLAERLSGPRLPLAKHPRWLVAAGFAFLASALWRPALFFPLVWGFMTLVLEPWNYRRARATSLLADLEEGRYQRLARLLAAGATVGLIWETLNALAGTRWIYTVPGLEGHKLFEMPLPGFLGFPVFALDCFVAYQALANAGLVSPGWGELGAAPGGATRKEPESLDRSERAGSPRYSRLTAPAAVTLALVFGIGVAFGMDRWTIDSVYPEMKAMPGLTTAEAAALNSVGIERIEQLARSASDRLASTGLPPGRTEALSAQAQLIMLRGIGITNASGLGAAGVTSVCDLARADPARIAESIRAYRADPHAGRLARVRVWVRSAERACPGG